MREVCRKMLSRPSGIASSREGLYALKEVLNVPVRHNRRYTMPDTRHFACHDCNHQWSVPYGTGQNGQQMKCPKCGSTNIHRAEAAGQGRGRGPSPAGKGRGGPGRGPRFQE
jgi:predicted RNA-binding Zn-ribbon protein involved in translation (DUF1610 family)